ncbi:MAG: 2'-deoxycytidine 5'-triphosphate deaminase, partial [Pseudomonadota bacterium]
MPQDPDNGSSSASGVIPDAELRELIGGGQITANVPIDDDQIQPASLDLRLGHTATRLRASFLAGPDSAVGDRLGDLAMHRVDLTGGAVLEKGCVYLVELQERLALPDTLSAVANAKSSTGRLDLLTRTITDRGVEFDRVSPGYHGPLYAEICPRSFSVLVRPGMRLNQLRLRRGDAVLSDGDLAERHARNPLVLSEGDSPPAHIEDGL